MRVKIRGANTEANEPAVLDFFWVTVVEGFPVVTPIGNARTAEEARAFRDDLMRGVLGRKGERVLPSEPGFLEALQFEFKSAYFFALKPDADDPRARQVRRVGLANSPTTKGVDTAPKKARFSALVVQKKREQFSNALTLSPDQFEKLPEGLSVSPVDPMAVLACLDALSLKNGLSLRAYQFISGGNGNGFVYALPEAAPFPSPNQCSTAPVEAVPGVVLDQPRPPQALGHVMDAFDGDGSVWSFMEASLLCREIAEFGAVWHGCEWDTHEILDTNPLATPAARGRRERELGKPSDWKWRGKEPRAWSPTVTCTVTGSRVRFVTVSELGQCAFFEHTDRFTPGSYRPVSRRRTLAVGPGGYVY